MIQVLVWRQPPQLGVDTQGLQVQKKKRQRAKSTSLKARNKPANMAGCLSNIHLLSSLIIKLKFDVEK
jgi:hypothetical protein